MVANLFAKFELDRKIVEVSQEKSVEKQILWNTERLSRENTGISENIEDDKTELESLLTCNFRVVGFSPSIF